MAKEGPRTYSPEQREEALALYVEHGPAAAASRLGIPASTVRSWAKRAGKQSPRADRAVAGAEAARRTWAQRRADVALESGEAASELIERIRGTSKAREAADWSRAFAIAVDKAQLLDGGATGRVEVSSHEERVRRVAELAGRWANLTVAAAARRRPPLCRGPGARRRARRCGQARSSPA
jgi:transposase-like protein